MARPADPNARSALLAAAREEMARRGLKGARIEDITAACGLSKGAFYLHFASKEALLRELVQGFIERMQAENEARIERMRRFLEVNGPITRSDVVRRSKRYRALFEMEVQADVQILEQLWENRDVFSILLRGSQGTEFHEAIWDLLDGQVARVIESYRSMQAFSALRSDVQVELLATMSVGGYFLIGTQMMRATEKPDLLAMAQGIHRLLRESTLAAAVPSGEDGASAPRAASKKVSARKQPRNRRKTSDRSKR